MKNTTSITRRTQVRPELTRSGAPWLRYKKLAFSLALAAGSLSVAGVASAAGGVAAGAGPTGGTVVGGIGSITQNGASTVINQQSRLLSLNWQTFNVGKDASVLFNQPSFNAVALNRILDQSPSQIFGRINSNGQIFLINTHGIIFGSSAQLNVGGLVASTLDLTPDDFLKQHFNLDAHGGHAGIVNQGTIAAASGGSVSLIGGHVENDGLIVANYGQINLDGADKAVLDFDGDGLVNIQITGALEQRLDTEQAAVANKGTLRATDGTVVLQASAAKNLFTDLVNNSGVVDAHGISTDGGVVRLVGNGGNTVSSGSIDVSGVHGGSAQLLSDQNVGVTGGSINASGTQGGGSIRVGGGWQGGEGLQTASATYVAPDATLKADATQSGNGGSVVVWGDNANNFYGSISARGGAGGGNGGRVETSAHYGLNAQGTVDASAPRGSNGTWLLDPYDVTIGTTASGTAWANPYTPAATSTIKASNVGGALTGGTNVFVFTNTAANGTDTGNITLAAPISATGKGSLYLEAVGSILLDSTITAKNTSSPINVYLWANYGGAAAGTIYSSNAACATCQVIIGDTASAGITTDGGGVDIRTGDATNAGGSVQLGSSGTITGSIDTGGGTLNVIANGISQQATGASTITAGSASLAAGAGAINLANGGNDFSGTVNLSNSGANDVALDNGSNALTLGNVVVGTGTLSLSGTGLSQVAATAITQGAGAGAVTLDGGAGAISLANSGNDFSGTVSLGNSGANNVALNNGSNALTLGNVTVGTGTLSLSGTGLSQAATTAITQGAGAGAVTLNGGAGAISLANSGNDFTGTVNLSNSGANNVALNNGSNALSLGSASVGGSLDVASSGGITLTQNVTSGAGQTYENAVTLGSDVIATSTGSGAIDFVSTVDGAHNLAVNTGGSTTFGGTVGGTTALTSLTTDSGGSTTLAADVSTTGNQTYGDALSLGNAAMTLTGNTVDLEGGASGSSALTIAGNAVLKGTSSLSSLSVSGTSSLQGSITTSGTQTFGGATTLTGDTTLVSTGSGAGGVIGFDDLVDGGANLGITSTAGSVSFAKAVGSVTPLGSLSVDAGSISLGGNVTTSGTQDFTGTLSFGNTSTTLAGSTVTLNSALNQASENLTITGDGAFGSTVDLASLDVSGKATLDGNVTTSGAQTYNGAVTLGSDVTAASSGNGAIDFASTVDGAHVLDVNTGGATIFGGAVGGTTALTSLTTDAGGSTMLGGNITTTGAQTYNDAVTLTGNVAATSTGGGAITLNSTVDGAHALAVNTAGATTFGGAVGGTTALTSLTTDAGGSTALHSNVKTTGAQTYNDAVALGTNVTATSTGGGAIAFNSTVDGAYALAVDTAGVTTFGGAVGGSTALTGVATDAAGSTMLGGNVTTTGAQTYNDAVALGSDVTVSSTTGAGNIDFASTVDGAHALTVNTSGITTFGGAVGGTTALASITTDAGGSTALGGNITTTGAQTYNDAVTLTGGVTATSTANGNIDFASTVDGAHALAVNTGGTTLFDGVVGGTTALTSLATGPGGTTTLNGNVSTTGAQTYNDAVALGTDVTAASSGNGAIAFNSTVDGAHNLVVNTGGQTTFGGAVGGTTALASLTTDAAGTTRLGGDVSTSGAQNYNDAVALTGNVVAASSGGNIGFASTVDGAHTLAVNTSGTTTFGGAVGGTTALASLGTDAGGGTVLGGNVNTTGAQTYNDAVALGADVTAASSGGGAIAFNSTVDGAHSLAASTSGATTFGAAVGGNTALTSLTTNAGGSTALNGNINTTGSQTYNDAVNLGGDVTVASSGAGNIDFAASVDGAHNLTVNTGGQSAFGTVGGTVALASLTTDAAGTTTLNGNVSTTGAQTYNDAVALGADAAVSSSGGGAISFNSTVDGAHALAVNTGGAVAFAGTVGGTTKLASLDSSSGTFSANALSVIGDVSVLTTGGGIAQGGAWSVGGTSDFNAGSNAITLASAGNDFTGAVTLTGGTTQIVDKNALTLGALSTGSLTATSTGALNLGSGTVNGNLVATSNGGAISQNAVGALTVTGSSNLNAGAGSITLANANNDFQGQVTATGTGVSLRDVNDLTIASLTDNNNGSVSLVAGGNLNLPAGAIDTGTGNLTLAANGGTLSANGALSGNNVSLSGYNGLLIANDITATGTLSLVSGNGAISQSGGVLTANALAGNSAGATTLMGLNHVANLGAFSSGGDFAFNDAQSLTVNSALSANSGAGNLTLTTTGATSDLTLATSLTGNTVTLGAGRNLTQTSGKITANTLTGSAAGSASLTGANLISNLGNFSANGFSLTNAQALNVAGTVNGGTGAADISTTSGALSVNSTVSGNGVSLDGNGGLAINAAVNSGAGTTTLNSGSTISEGAAGVVIAGTLTGSSNGATTLNGANQVGTLGDFSANGFSLTNAQALAAAGVIDGHAGGTTLKTTSGDLTIDGTAGNTAAATALISAGAITEGATGVVKASTLTGSSAGAATLNGANQIASLGNFTANGFSLTDAGSLTITGAVNGGSGATSIATSVAGSDLDVGASGSVAGTGVALASGGAINAAAGSTIKSNNAALSLGGTSLALDGAVDAGTGTATLTSGGAITQAAGSGIITAGTLTGSSTGATTLNGANKVAALGNFSANGFSLTNAQALAVNGTVDGGAVGTALKITSGDLTINDTVGNTAGATTLTSAGAINESASGVVKATTLTGSSGGATALNGANQVANLGNFTANGFSLTDAQSLTVAAGSMVNGGSSTVLVTSGAGHDLGIDGTVGNAGGAVTLTSAGSINEGAGGVIVANTLAGSAVGDAILDGANRINTLGQFGAANLSLVNAQALSVVGPLSTTSGSGDISLTTTGAGNVLSVGQVLTGGTITLDSGGALNVTNDVQGSTVNLAAHGNLAINAAVNSGAGTTTLTQSGAGSISESAGGSIVAGTLTGSSQGTTALTGANKVATLSDFTGNGFSLTNAQVLTVAGNINGGTGATSLATTSGALNVFGDVNGGSVSLNGAGGLGVNGTVNSGNGTTTLASGAAITEGSGGLITAGTLAGHSSGSTTLNGPNSISNLGSFSANGFSLTNAKTLTLAAGATVDGGANTALTTTAGNITINGVLKGTSTKLKSAGSIGEGTQGVINAGTLAGSANGAANLDGANRVASLGNFTADGFSLTNAQSLAVAAGATVDGDANTSLATTTGDLAIDGTVKGTTTTLKSAGAINEGAGGVVNAGTLTGSSIADTTLNGANRIGTLGAFTAKDLYLTDAQALVVDGPVSSAGNAGDISLTTTGGTANTLTVNQAVHGRNITLASAGDLSVANTVAGSSVKLAATGNLGINAAVDSGTGVVTLTQAGSGAISEGATGAITAGTLSGSATGTTTLGTSANFMNNQVDVLGNFSSPGGFSFTNGRTLTLSSVNGSAFTVDAGQSNLYLAVRNGDLLQTGNTWLYDGQGTWSASGHIGLATAPIYVIGVSNQFVQDIGLPPAYFYALDTNGKLLPITGGPSVNVPTAALSGGSENTNGHGDNYIDVSVFTANYRSFGIVPSGILLPEDQQLCSPTEQSQDECPEGN